MVFQLGFGGMVEFMWGEAESLMRESPLIYDMHCDLYENTYSTGTLLGSPWPNTLGSFSSSSILFFFKFLLFLKCRLRNVFLCE